MPQILSIKLLIAYCPAILPRNLCTLLPDMSTAEDRTAVMESFKRAQQGDADSIAAVLDAQLRPQGVTVTGTQTVEGLQLSFMGVTVEQQLILQPYLREVLTQLRVPEKTVQIQGCTAQGKLIWQTTLHLADALTLPPVAASAVSENNAQVAIANRSRRRRLLILMILAAIAGIAVAVWQTNSQQIQPEPTEPTRSLTNQS